MRMLHYEQSRREEGARRAREKADRALLTAKVIRESLRGGRRGIGKRGRGKVEEGGTTKGTQTESEGWQMNDIQERLTGMLAHARYRLREEINELEEEIHHDKENTQVKEEGSEDEETEAEKTARLTYLHCHLLVCEKLEKQVLDCLDSTFALLQAYGGTGEETTEEGEEGGKKKKRKPGKRMSKFERLLLEEKEKDILRLHRQQDDALLTDISHSASSSAFSSASGSSQSLTFLQRPSFHTVEVSERASHRPARAHWTGGDEHSIVIPSPTSATSPVGSGLVRHDPSSSIITFPKETSPPHPRRLSSTEKQQLFTNSPKRLVLNYPTINEEKEPTHSSTTTGGAILAGLRRLVGGGGHTSYPSMVYPPIHYTMEATPGHHSHRSNVSTDLKVLSMTGTGVMTAMMPTPSAPPVREEEREEGEGEGENDLPVLPLQLHALPDSPSSLLSPPASPSPYPASCHADLYRHHALPPFLSHTHHLLLTQLRHYRSTLTTLESSSHSILRQWSLVCRTLAERGCRVLKFHGRGGGRGWVGESGVRWLGLSGSGVEMEWRSRRGGAVGGGLLLASVSQVLVGEECEFVNKFKQRGGKLTAQRGGWGQGQGFSQSNSVLDVNCCVSFVGLKRSLDVVFEHRLEVEVWLWIVQEAQTDRDN